MKIYNVLEKLLTSLNLSSRKPIYETYDKNVQGNTVHERGKVAASICTPFRNFPELSEEGSKTGVAIATGGNPNFAKISSGIASAHAVIEATIKVSCVGGTPLCVTDCLNFGNPEKKEQMGEFVDGVDGLKKACIELDIPIVSGNVSFYNESDGKSVPPSALMSVFARVDDPAKVPQLGFQTEDEIIFLIGKRSNDLGGSAFLKVCDKKDSRLPAVDFEHIKTWINKLQEVASDNLISTASPINDGGLLCALMVSSFENGIGFDIKIPDDDENKILQFLFSEDPGVAVATNNPNKIKEIFGSSCMEIGSTTKGFEAKVKTKNQEILNENLHSLHKKWENRLRKVF